jgi:hypothetical protein
MGWRERPRLAKWSFNAIYAVWIGSVAWALLTGVWPSGAWFVVVGLQGLAVGTHLIVFCREDAARFREQGRRFWRPFGLGGSLAEINAPFYVALMGLLLVLVGLLFVAAFLQRR